MSHPSEFDTSSPTSRYYIASDVGRSSSFSPGRVLTEEVLRFHKQLEDEFPAHILYESQDKPMTAYVDAINLAYAKHCISFGGGNLAKTATYMRLRMGKDPCLLLTLMETTETQKCRLFTKYRFRSYRGKSFGYRFGDLADDSGIGARSDRSRYPKPPPILSPILDVDQAENVETEDVPDELQTAPSPPGDE